MENLTWLDYATFLVALIALIQPWVMLFIKKRRHSINVFPSRIISIGFTNRGICIQTSLSLVSKNKEAVVTDLIVSILDHNAREIYRLDADQFRNPYEISITHNEDSRSFQESIAKAHPVHIDAGKTQTIKVVFVDREIERFTQDFVQKTQRDDLLRLIRLQPGNYKIVFVAKDTVRKTHRQEYCVCITADDIEKFKQDIDTILAGKTTFLIDVEITPFEKNII